MNARQFSEALGELDSSYLAEAISYDVRPGRRRRLRRLPAVLIAAVLALLLMGVGVTAAIYRGEIPAWLSRRWEEMTGRPMGEGQQAVIEHLSQVIGLSQTVDGVTVTLDSATVSYDGVSLLLKLEGLDRETAEHSRFRYTIMRGREYNIMVSTGPGSKETNFDINEDGTVYLLMYWPYPDGTQDRETVQLTLELRDLIDISGDEETVLTAGKWQFSFTLDRSQVQKPVMLPDAQAGGYQIGPTESKGLTVTLKNIQLTDTCLSFQYNSENDTIFLCNSDMAVVLKNGLVLKNYDTFSTNIYGSPDRRREYHWRVPLDLEEVASVRIGGTEIPVP